MLQQLCLLWWQRIHVRLLVEWMWNRLRLRLPIKAMLLRPMQSQRMSDEGGATPPIMLLWLQLVRLLPMLVQPSG